METKILYYDDIYFLDFEANILSVEKIENEYHIILDQTAFYPDSGGMPADKGLIDNIEVINVIKKNNNIIHILKDKPTNLNNVQCKVDSYTRFTNIQIHDAQHLLTALFENDMDLVTVSHHVHGDYCDLILEGPTLTIEMMETIEKKANDCINKQLDLDIFMIPKSDLGKYGLKDNPKYSDPVRITNIKTLDDYNACGCLHFNNISYIQGVKYLSIEKSGKQNKILFTAGLRMIEYFDKQNKIISELRELTKSNEDNMIINIKNMIDKNIELTKELNETKTQLMKYRVDELVSNNDKIIIYNADENMEFSDLKVLSNTIMNYNKPIIALLQIKKDDKYQFILVKQKDSDYQLEEIFAKLKENLNIHGGGKGQSINGQSTVDLSKEIENYL